MLFIGKFRTFLISLIISAITLTILPGFDLASFILLTLLLWSLLNIKGVCEKIFEFLFDIFDLVFLGKLTNKLCDFYSCLSIQEQRKFKTKLNGSFIQHLYNSRQGFGSNNRRHRLWEDYYVSLFQYFAQDEDLLKNEIDRYWQEADKPDAYYENNDPLIFSSHLDWICHEDWRSATPATVKFVLNKIEDINETQGYPRRTLLGTAVSAGAPLDLIKMIVESGADPNAKQEIFPSGGASEFSIIHCAVNGSSTEVIQYLFDNGLDIDLAYQNHALSIAEHAAVYSDSLDTLRLIFENPIGLI